MISPTDYENILCQLHIAITCSRGASSSIQAADAILSDMALTGERRQSLRDKLENLDDTIRVPLPSQVDNFFKGLQKHIEVHYGLTRFLADYGITVTERVAEYSALLGYIIPEEYITEFCISEYGEYGEYGV